MAIATGLALGLAAAGAFGAGKYLGGRNKKPETQPLAPGPTEPSAIGPPEPPLLNPAANLAAAKLAGEQTRKRAMKGSLLTRPKAPKSLLKPTEARLAPKSLIGY